MFSKKLTYCNTLIYLKSISYLIHALSIWGVEKSSYRGRNKYTLIDNELRSSCQCWIIFEH